MFPAICSELKNFYQAFLLGYPRYGYLAFTRIFIVLIQLHCSESQVSCCPVLLGIYSLPSPSLRLYKGSFYSEICFFYISSPLCTHPSPFLCSAPCSLSFLLTAGSYHYLHHFTLSIGVSHFLVIEVTVQTKLNYWHPISMMPATPKAKAGTASLPSQQKTQRVQISSYCSHNPQLPASFLWRG